MLLVRFSAKLIHSHRFLLKPDAPDGALFVGPGRWGLGIISETSRTLNKAALLNFAGKTPKH